MPEVGGWTIAHLRCVWNAVEWRADVLAFPSHSRYSRGNASVLPLSMNPSARSFSILCRSLLPLRRRRILVLLAAGLASLVFDGALAGTSDSTLNMCFRGRTIWVPPYMAGRFRRAGATDGPCGRIVQKWVRRYEGPAQSTDQATALAVDRSGNVIVTGNSAGIERSVDYHTVKYAASNGKLMWQRRHNGRQNRHDQPRSVAVDRSGNAVVTGYSKIENNSDDYYTAKYAAADGALLWERSYNGPGNGNDQACAVALDGSGNAIVTGLSEGVFPIGTTYYTAKYAAADGALIWEKRSPGEDDTAAALRVDGSGNVIVTGGSRQVGETHPHYYTVKYAAADGAVLWEKRHGGSDGRDEARAVAVDGTGNVIVTGFSYNAAGNSDYYTAKYRAADGELLWERHHDGSSGTYDYSIASAVDTRGNVIVTGSEGDGDPDGFSRNFYTAKYAAEDGALLWERRFSESAQSYDYPAGLAVDRAGNVVVTGKSLNANSEAATVSHVYTAMYAAANGALLWKKRYDGGQPNGFDEPSAVAVDRVGNVMVTGSSQRVFAADFLTIKYVRLPQ